MLPMEAHVAAVSDRNGENRSAFENLGGKALEAVELLDADMEEMQDFDGTQLQLYPYQYTIGDSEPIRTLVAKGSYSKKLTAEVFNHLLGLRNNKMLVPVLSYYYRGSNWNGWFILSPVQGSLKGWLSANRDSLMFEGNGIKRAMSGTFRTMLIDMWDLLIEMSAKEILPAQVKLEDFFVTFLADHLPRIQLLITEIKELRRLVDIKEEREKTWSQVDAMISKCCELCGCELNDISKKFCKYIKTCNEIREIKSYPDIWTIDDKSRYIYHIVSGKPPFKRHEMRSKVNVDSKVKWPDGPCGPPHAILLILKLKENNYTAVDANGKKVLVCRYKTSKAYDYIQLCRDNHKHFDKLPHEIKELLGGTREGLIDLMESWDPEIWTKLYEAIGPLGLQLDS